MDEPEFKIYFYRLKMRHTVATDSPPSFSHLWKISLVLKKERKENVPLRRKWLLVVMLLMD